MEKTPAATAKRLQSPRHYRALIRLMKGPATVRQLMDAAGCNGVPQIVACLRRKGLLIDVRDCSGFDRDGLTVRYGKYELNPQSIELAEDLINSFSPEGA
ncbi:hypothetical protein [Marinobacter sp. NFXS9]|uniref:hypothetical protein n=1 Tax=Marinobacter sp. NFXS9 TaxID=2818433 RepID=UPI0032DFBDBD